MTPREFTEAMTLLAVVHGADQPPFTNADIAEVWYEYFKPRCTGETFKRVIKNYLAHCPWMPKSPSDVWKLWSEEQRPPGEDFLGYSLPSKEVRLKAELDSMTPEQMEANRQRLAQMTRKLVQTRSMKRSMKV